MSEDTPATKTAKVIVLGDIGRSPRMQYHALSLANMGLTVKVIGYVDSTPLAEVLEHKNISIHKLNPLILSRGPKLVQYAMKAFWQTISLFLTLCITGSSEYLLCQNPPAIPTLPVCWFYCLVTRTKFFIDWHNYAYSIMALSLKPGHFLLNIARMIEKCSGQTAHRNFCVTYAMKEDLLQNWNISAKVLYDRPPKIFHPLTLQEKHKWFLKISEQYPAFGSEDINTTAFTREVQGRVELRGDRPGLLFSSTSWTPDEDFRILMEALQIYETTSKMTDKLPKLICVITGKGPMKEHYINLIAQKEWQNVQVITPWLEACDYPKMVASADLGVCLHTSSSGLDLPMKVVDMFGAGLPVCAVEFKCLDELVKNNVNGYTFKNYDELAKQTLRWFEDFPKNDEQNAIAERMRQELVSFQKTRWEDNWNLRIKVYFES